MPAPPRLALIPRIPGFAGPAAFQRRLAEALAARGVECTYDPDDPAVGALLVVGGTRALPALQRARRRGLPVVQRLDGMNWIHRRRPTGLRHFLRAEIANLLLRLIRDRLASLVIYQSRFAREWWERLHGPAPAPAHVVLNGVSLERFSPAGPERPPGDRVRLLIVEANLAGGYEIGLDWAFGLGRALRQGERAVEVLVAGRVPSALRRRWDRRAGAPHRWLGVVAHDDLPALHRACHLLFASDLMPACPNAVIEALASGLPVVSFDTGALPELVEGEAGRLAAYGADPWRLAPPHLAALGGAAREVLAEPERFRRGARRRAEAGLGLEHMAEGYLRALGWEGRPAS